MDGRDQRQLGEFIQVIEFIGLLGQEFARLVEIICKAYAFPGNILEHIFED